jgi:hypothetical protein
MEAYIEANREELLKLIVEKYVKVRVVEEDPDADVFFCDGCKLIHVYSTDDVTTACEACHTNCSARYCSECQTKHQTICSECGDLYCMGKCGDDRRDGLCGYCKLERTPDEGETCDATVIHDVNEKKKPHLHTYDGKWTTAEVYEGCPERYYFELTCAISLPDEWHFEIEDHDLVYDDDEIKGWYSIVKGKYVPSPEQKVNCVACVRHAPHCKEACGENGNCRVRSANFVCKRCGLDVCKKCLEVNKDGSCAECFGKEVEKPKLEGLFWKSFKFVDENMGPIIIQKPDRM